MDEIAPSPARLRRAIEELYFWQHSTDASNFTARLYDLISKADYQNRHKLSMVFLEESTAFMLWQLSDDENDFFETWLGHGVVRIKKEPLP